MSPRPVRVGRRQARRQALSLLYQWDLTGQELGMLHEGEIDPFALSLAQAVVERAPALDREITSRSHAWPAERLGHVERAVLRMALVELEQATVPRDVAIAEAVALAKRYGSDEAARLVNGILGGREAGAAAGPGEAIE